MTMGHTSSINSHTIQELPLIGFWEAQLRHQLGGKTLRGQGADSGCGTHPNQCPPCSAEILAPKRKDTSNRECSKSPIGLLEITSTWSIPLLAGLSNHKVMVWGHIMEAGVKTYVWDPGEPQGVSHSSLTYLRL